MRVVFRLVFLSSVFKCRYVNINEMETEANWFDSVKPGELFGFFFILLFWSLILTFESIV